MSWHMPTILLIERVFFLLTHGEINKSNMTLRSSEQIVWYFMRQCTRLVLFSRDLACFKLPITRIIHLMTTFAKYFFRSKFLDDADSQQRIPQLDLLPLNIFIYIF